MTFYAADAATAQIGEALVRRTLEAFGPKGLAADKLAITLLVHGEPLRGTIPPGPPRGFGYRADQRFYPCSVVKVFYLVAAQARLEEGAIEPHEELDRAMRDMILVSSNTATNYVIDLITRTTGDTLLGQTEWAEWVEKRNWVNRYFRKFGWPEFDSINVCQKLMDDRRYGREQMFAGADGRNHNALTTDATARLFYAIFTGQAVSQSRSSYMADRLSRSLDPAWIAAEPDAQVIGYFGAGLPQGAKLWSKAGHTRWTGDPSASYRRHDAAYIELPDGSAFTLVAFTEGKAISANEDCLPALARNAAELVASC